MGIVPCLSLHRAKASTPQPTELDLAREELRALERPLILLWRAEVSDIVRDKRHKPRCQPPRSAHKARLSQHQQSCSGHYGMPLRSPWRAAASNASAFTE